MRNQFHHLIQCSAQSNGDRPALTYNDATVTYAELGRLAERVGNGLKGIGLSPGDRVAVFLEKSIENVVALFATSAAGGVFVPINPLLRPAQVRHILRDCTVRVLVTSSARLDALRTVLESGDAPRSIVLIDSQDDRATVSGSEMHSWRDLMECSDAGSCSASERIDVDLAAILYTSGSTGMPKGVMLSHRNLIAGAESVNCYLKHGRQDVILAMLPLSFDAGLSQLTTGFGAAAHVVLVNYLLPQGVVRLCERHKITCLTGVPPLWLQLAEHDWPKEAAKSLRYFANTGGRLPGRTLQRLRLIFPQAAPYLMYGLTEAFRSTYLDPSEIDRRPDSIGKAIPNAEILVVRPDGSPCEAWEAGELVHRGALVALGYWNDADRTAERFRPAPRQDTARSIPDVAVWSGDIVKRDEEGFLYFVGRQDEMIKTSGYRVSPVEIEEAVHSTGLVRDAVALGIDDPALGHRIAIMVTPREGDTIDTGTLLEALKIQLPLYMLPRDVHIRHSLPRSPNGKFDRARIRAELAVTVAHDQEKVKAASLISKSASE